MAKLFVIRARKDHSNLQRCFGALVKALKACAMPVLDQARLPASFFRGHARESHYTRTDIASD
ncbi:hypothetical protein [Noviherbaspirillum saxi]|uniref:Uncharacterized protein n=1 Tax=Noviherbaspirillum saxi TaxID=2320863 RepID=A0A3A3FSW1_9BURK|nr:hypothetical protein [Noviherbaspirillum saxi]RJF97281.1 hypothetical protein D3871_01065 [Noviherbaspirillum saxi]